MNDDAPTSTTADGDDGSARARDDAISVVLAAQIPPEEVHAHRAVDALLARPALLVRLAVEAGALVAEPDWRRNADDKEPHYTFEPFHRHTSRCDSETSRCDLVYRSARASS